VTDEIKNTLKKLGLKEDATLDEIRVAVREHYNKCNGCDLHLDTLAIWITKMWLEVEL
jgi:hypothetical protein